MTCLKRALSQIHDHIARKRSDSPDAREEVIAGWAIVLLRGQLCIRSSSTLCSFIERTLVEVTALEDKNPEFYLGGKKNNLISLKYSQIWPLPCGAFCLCPKPMQPSCHSKFQNSSFSYVRFYHKIGGLRVLVKLTEAGWQIFVTRMF